MRGITYVLLVGIKPLQDRQSDFVPAQQSCTIPLQVMEYMHHSLNVTGVAQAPRRDVIEMLDFVEQHRVMPEVEVHAFDLVEEVLEALVGDGFYFVTDEVETRLTVAQGQQKIQGRAVLSLQ